MLAALSFLTIFGRSGSPDRTTMRWFPVVGVLIGAAVAGAHWLAHELWHPLAAGAIVVAVDLIMTGALHFDGLADSADGLLPHMQRDRRLQVMAEPTIGVFALVVVVATLLLRWTAFSDAELGVPAVIALWAASRSLAGAVPAFVPYARRSGLAASFLGGSKWWPALAIVPAAGVIVADGGGQGAAAVVAFAAAALALIAVARRRIGGFTGDVLGALIVITETVTLVAMVARP